MIHFLFVESKPQYLFLKYDTPEDDLWLKTSPRHTHKNLTDHLNLVDPSCYRKNYTGPMYTEDFLFQYITSKGEKVYYCSIGLWQDIYKFFEEHGVAYDGLPNKTPENNKFFKRKLKHTFEEFKSVVDGWGLAYNPRPYQYECAYNILSWKRSVSSIATRAGKTLISYIVFRYAMENLGLKNVLMIVPAVELVKQAKDDYEEYKDFFDVEQIYGGGEEIETANVTIGTFQSLIKYIERDSKKYNPHFFDKFDCVFVDEVHRAKAKQIANIISQPFMSNVKIAFGMTGTLPPEKTIDHYCIFSLLGAKIQAITTKQLKDAGYISDIEIFQCRLHYKDFEKTKQIWKKCVEYALGSYVIDENDKRVMLPPEKREFLLRCVKTPADGVVQAKTAIYNRNMPEDEKEYAYIKLLKSVVADSDGTNSLAVERMMIHLFEERIDYLLDEILPKCPRNTLILAHHTEYINYLTKRIEERFSDTRIVCKITGGVSDKNRKKIKQTLKENNNCILVASYGCMSTGITLANLCFGVFFESFKSNIINMQSIGRGLGLSDLKEKYILYDIVDCFNNDITNKIYLQGLRRIDIYEAEENQHKYNIVNVNLGEDTGDWKELKKRMKTYTQIRQPDVPEIKPMSLQLDFD